MAEAPVGTKTVFIDVGKGPEAFTVVTDYTHTGNLIPTVLPELQTVKILEVLPRGGGVDSTFESQYVSPPSEPAQRATGLIDLTTTEEQKSCIQIQRIKCPKCPRYISKSNIKKHEVIHRKDNTLRCTECPFIGKNKPNLNKHLKDNHAPGIPTLPTKELTCKVCDFTTRIRKKWHAHNWYHHKLYKCKTKKCTFGTTRQSKYNEHVKNCNPEEMLHKTSAFKCGICSWSSKHHVRILLHLIHHPDQEVDESVVDISVLRKHGIR